jgi:hypothetical protein
LVSVFLVFNGWDCTSIELLLFNYVVTTARFPKKNLFSSTKAVGFARNEIYFFVKYCLLIGLQFDGSFGRRHNLNFQRTLRFFKFPRIFLRMKIFWKVKWNIYLIHTFIMKILYWSSNYALDALIWLAFILFSLFKNMIESAAFLHLKHLKKLDRVFKKEIK